MLISLDKRINVAFLCRFRRFASEAILKEPGEIVRKGKMSGVRYKSNHHIPNLIGQGGRTTWGNFEPNETQGTAEPIRLLIQQE